MTSPVIGYAGLSHLGVSQIAAAAAKGFECVGFDLDIARVEAVSRGQIDIVEPGLPELLSNHASRIRFTADPEVVAGCDVLFISRDVPTDDSGVSDLAPIQRLIDLLMPHLGDAVCLVILAQVPPGFTRSIVRRESCLFYQVETLIFGRAVERAMKPERFIVGSHAPQNALPQSYSTFLGAFGCPILRMRYESAELAKISINACLAAMVSTANTLAELCELIGADWSEIVPALRLDKRIGPDSYLHAGLGLSGGNIERDLETLVSLAEMHGADDRVVRSWISNSRYRRDWVLHQLHGHVLDRVAHPEIAILGLAYKANTHSMKNSPTLALLQALKPYTVRVYDPVVRLADGSATQVETAIEACRGADAVAVMTPWPEFHALDPTSLASELRGKVVIDPFGVLSAEHMRRAELDHLVLGSGTRKWQGGEA